MTQPRAVGVRQHYDQIPERVRDWVDRTLGSSVVTTSGQIGGMSPGCAARIETADGQRAFVKAVGEEINADTVGLFRHELGILRLLPPVPYRPALLAEYDEDGWVAILLEDVEGRHPDLTDQEDADAVWDLVLRQTRELTPAPDGVQARSLADVTTLWAQRWDLLAADPGDCLPDWVDVPAAARIARELPDRLVSEALCHWDIRDDNLLIRPTGEAVVVDWGMAVLGPWWADAFALCLEWVDLPAYDERIGALPGLTAEVERLLDDTLLTAAGAFAWKSRQPYPPSLPNLATFTRELADRMFAGVARRSP
ncbi:aminoglycoside phosphotransferase family protein [Luteipulveratus sp. YIM 133132]|uniref:aminoglycoside phosphotransferase family protein n=1 Tax=Luteipulveratus flavus TaxID=3031728 RepID=UPI0023B1AEE5|nr:aminoglycoside phosphotransferase family protein [Luteipulveratus sp. YIM 133132]MDE9367802.1 aminoglycoside phosphotransferase family protein [Luteipulveratus sp. YIM 133132]